MHPDPVILKLVVYASLAGTVRERERLENQSSKSPRQVDNRVYNNVTYF
jgi:hypothetical protein